MSKPVYYSWYDSDGDKIHKLTRRQFETLRGEIGENCLAIGELNKEINKQLNDLKWRITMLEEIVNDKLTLNSFFHLAEKVSRIDKEVGELKCQSKKR